MRVLLVSHHYPPDTVGGVERITQALGRDLARYGDSVAIATRRFTSEGLFELTTDVSPEGATIYRLSGSDFSERAFLKNHQALEEMFVQVLEAETPDVVHFLHLRGHSPRLLDLAHSAGAAVVVSLQDFYFACPRIVLLRTDGEWCAGPEGGNACAHTCYRDEGAGAARWTLRAAYWQNLVNSAERLVCPSTYMANFFERQGADAERMRVIPNGVSLVPRVPWEQFAPRAENSSLQLLFLGTVLPHKGAHLVLDALALAQLGCVDLVIAGAVDDHAYARQLRERAAQIPNLRLRFYGAYETEALPLLLRGVDCVITPSAWNEAFGIVTREALHEGVPVIVSRVGGLAEAVKEGENGFTFSPEQPAELVSLLQRLVGEPDLLPRLRAGARATRVLTTSEHASMVRETYREALDVYANSKPSPNSQQAVVFDSLCAAGFADDVKKVEAL